MKTCLLALVSVLAAATGRAADANAHWNGGRTVPVHRLVPRDAAGQTVSVTGYLPRPISMARTCGQCHDVAALHRGSHFRTGLDMDDAKPSVDVEPWFWADEKTGTAIPLSLHGQAGALRPAEVGLSCWQWTKLFGRHFPGGGIGCDTNAMAEVAGERQRWFVTGALEPNCLACHQQRGYDSSEWARQVLRENWTGAATAASGLAAVEGMNERLESTWTAPENPDDHLFRVPEKTVYDLTKFDHKGRCVFDVGRPRSENCLACHGVSQKGMPSHEIAGDVHLKRGMACVDCHRNGMDHRVATTGCAECHTGANGAGPKPLHAGIPLVHFEKLACTVCHSGVTRDGALAQVRTARANRIGVYGRAQWATDCPGILEPVFVRNAKGVVEPRRMMWPSGFRRVETNGTLRAIAPAEAAALAGDALTVVDRVKAALALLKETDGPVGVTTLLDDGRLVYRTGTNDVPYVAAEDRAASEFKNLLITLYNAKLGVTKETVAACRAGKVYTIDGSGTVTECAGVPAPADAFPVGTLSADGKAFVPMLDAWTLRQYAQVKDGERPLTQEMVARALANAGKDVRYLAAGLVFSLDGKGGLVKTAGAPEAQPVSWPVGHDVRPARQARGAAPVKCAACHSGDSAFFLGTIRPTGPVLGVEAPELSRAELMGLSGTYQRLLGSTFAMRPLLKVFLWTVFGLLCLFAAAAAAFALRALMRKAASDTDDFLWGLVKWSVDMGLVASVLYLAASGVLGWLCGGMSGIWLMLHMVAGGAFAGCVVLLAVFRGGAAARGECVAGGLLWMLWTVLAAGTVFTAVMPMMTVFGSHGQEILLWCHRCTTLCLVAVGCAICWGRFKKR